MESNNKAFGILFLLVLTSVAIFCAEKIFLVAEPRGGTLSKYINVEGIKKVFLLVEDFEGFDSSGAILPKKEFFNYGNVKISVDHFNVDQSAISSRSCLQIQRSGNDNYGGWGKGVGANVDMDSSADYFNFRIYVPEINTNGNKLKIILEEDDNNDGILQKDKDDAWCYFVYIEPKNKWQLVSIPLKKFKDDNEGGDHKLNITRKGGLHTLIFDFQEADKFVTNSKLYFDFICFSHGSLSADQLIDD